MYRKILLCYDGTIEGRRALREGAELAMATNAEAYLLAIVRSMVATSVPEGITPELMQSEQNTTQVFLNEGVQMLTERGVTAKGTLVRGDPSVHIPQVAKHIGADLIVVGYRHRNPFARWWTNSEQETLLSRVSCSILVAMSPIP